MSKWEKVRLGDVSNINMGQSPSSESYNEEKDGIPFYQGNADFGQLHPTVRLYCNKPTKIANKNDVLLSVRAPIGALNIAIEKCCIGRGLCAITQIEDTSYFKYLFYVLKYLNSELISKGTGSTFKAINKTNLLNLEIPLPPLDAQQHIADILDKTQEIIDGHKKQLEELDHLIKANFYDIFGDPVVNNRGWQTSCLGEICENLDSLRIPITAKDRVKGIYPYYGASGIVDYVNDYIFDEDLLLVSEDGANLLARVTPIAFSVSGEIWVNNHAHVLRFEKKETQIYVEFVINHIDISNYVTGSAQPKLNQSKLNSMEIPVPPLDLQTKFASIVSNIEEQKAIVKQSLKESETLFASLMSNYFDE